MQAVLEEACANRAQLLQGGQGSGSPPPPPPRENSCPNNNAGGGSGSASAACGVPEQSAGIPAARMTVHIGGCSAEAPAGQAAAAAMAEGEDDGGLDALD